MVLDASSLTRPFDETTFIRQLLEAGVPAEALSALSSKNSPSSDPRLPWLYEDILKNEAMLADGKRHSQVVGVFAVAAGRLLLERSTALGARGELPSTVAEYR